MSERRFHTDVCRRANENEMPDLQILEGHVQIGSDEPVMFLFLDNQIPLPGFQLLDDVTAPRAVDMKLLFRFGILVNHF